MSEKGKTTRVSHAPDWMISGLVRAAAFPDQQPEQPMFATGVTYSQLKDQIKAMLTRSGLNLTNKELSSGGYWLAQRISNDLSEGDTKETLIDKINEFTAQYIVDKATQRATGVSERSPIRDRAWYDKNFTPPTDHEASVKTAGIDENLAKLPPKSFAELPSNGALIMIVRGEKGYTTLTVHGQTGAKGGARALNEQLGITPEQAEAMLCGSMFGWHTPAANPDMWVGKRKTVYKDEPEASGPPVTSAPAGTKPHPKMNPRLNSMASGEESEGDEIDMVYVGLDGDDMGHMVEDSLLSDDPEVAAKISNSIHDAHRAIKKLVQSVTGRVIFDGGDNMLIYMMNEPDVFEAIRDIHKRTTKHSVTIGVGHRPIEAHYALVVGKNTGKDKTVIYDEKVKAQHEAIHHEQKQLEDTAKKLKYRASSVEFDVAGRLRRALSAQGEDSSDKAIKELFWRLVQHFDLTDIQMIESFFSSADDASLVSAARQTYAKRMDWSLRCSEARELTKVEGQSLFRSLLLAIEAGKPLDEKFQALIKVVDDQTLRDLDEAGTVVGERFNRVANDFAEMIDDEKTLRYSHYADEVHLITAEIASMAIPLDAELTAALRAVCNAEDADNQVVDVSSVIKLVTKWVDRVNAAAMALDMVCVVSGARPMEMVAADPNSKPTNFPGQESLPTDHGQKSPHKRHDWLSIEDYNKHKVDWPKTDLSYVSTNVPHDSDIPVGGAGGGDPIYVP